MRNPKDNKRVSPMSDYYKQKDRYKVLVAVGDPAIRWKIIHEQLEKDTEYATFVDEKALILDPETIKIHTGSMIMANVVLTTNIIIGEHAVLNPCTTVGHDTRIDSFFTSAPGVNIAGNCKIGKRNIFGIASSMKQQITTCDDVILGLNTGVVKNIVEPGTYICTPAKKLY